jgi:hypothetical protein
MASHIENPAGANGGASSSHVHAVRLNGSKDISSPDANQSPIRAELVGNNVCSAAGIVAIGNASGTPATPSGDIAGSKIVPNQDGGRICLLIIKETKKRCGRYQARVEGFGVILTSSRQPLLDGARELLKRGADPSTTLIMRRSEQGIDALRATVGAAAKLTVEEPPGGCAPQFRVWEAYPRSDTQDEEKRTGEQPPPKCGPVPDADLPQIPSSPLGPATNDDAGRTDCPAATDGGGR